MTTQISLPGPLKAMGGILSTILKSGFRSSEFVLSLLAVVLVPLLALADPAVAAWAASNGWVGGLVAAVYAAGRSYVKATAVKQDTAARVIEATTPPLTLPVETAEGVRNLTAAEIRNLPPLSGGNPKEL